MLKTEASIEQITNEVVDFLSRYIKVEKVILYGSYSYGAPQKDSDFDLAIVSEDFERMSVLEKIDLFAKTSIAVDSRVELIGFSKSDFLNPSQLSLLKVIKDNGRVMF